MLIPSDRHTDPDKRAWRRWEDYDRTAAWSPILQRRIESAVQHIADFRSSGSCYAGVSWGKDSVVVAGLIQASGLRIPLVWVRVEPKLNPDCLRVRDVFLSRFRDADYHEIEVHCVREPNGTWSAKGTLEQGFAEAARRFGDRHISGVRSEESAQRKLREAAYGVATESTCAPITRWTGAEVFAYLHRCNLPVHPAYACTFGGVLERERVRVAHLGGSRGTGKSRREWEWMYYRDELRALGETLKVLW